MLYGICQQPVHEMSYSHKINEQCTDFKYCKRQILIYPQPCKRNRQNKIYNTLTCATKSGITNILK